MKNYKILVVGSHGDESALADILSRLSWYFHNSKNLKIEIVSQSELPERLPRIDHFYSKSQEYYSKIKAFTKVIDAPPEFFTEYRYVLNTDHSYEVDRRSLDRIVDVDSNHTTEDSQRYIEILNELNHTSEGDVLNRSRDTFSRMYKVIKEKNNHTNFVNLFGAGPGLSEIFGRKTKIEGINVICNSSFNNKDLLKVIDPDILVFSDPIFHFGPSVDTEEFIESVKHFVESFPKTLIAIPLKYAHIYSNNYGTAIDNIIFVPTVIAIHPNLNLVEGFNLKITNNILTYMMLPFGCTFGSHLSLYGFDGKQTDDNTQFWHSSKHVEEIDKVSAIEKSHPAFFNGPYPNYYSFHVQIIAKYIEYGELHGFTYSNKTKSLIPPLSQRSRESRLLEDNGKKANSTLFLSICPSLTSTFGHHHHQEVCIQRVLGQEVAHAVLTHVDCDIPNSTLKLIPCFTNKSWEPVTDDVRRNFYIEALEAIKMASHKYEKIVVYQYMGSHELLDEYIRLAYACHGMPVSFSFNLFYLCYKINTQRVVFSPHLDSNIERKLRWGAGNLGNVKFYLDNDVLLDNAEALFDYKFRLWPHFDVTEVFSEAKKSTSDKIIYYPSSFQLERGVDLLLSHLRDKEKVINSRLIPVVRLCDPAEQQNYIKLVESELMGFPEHIEYVYGELSNEEYAELFANADIIVLPYRAEYFYQRTSSALIDAAKLGIPTLTTRGTWLGGIVEKYKLGATFDEECEESFWSSVQEILSDYDDISRNCLDFESGGMFSPNNLIEELYTETKISKLNNLQSFMDLFYTISTKADPFLKPAVVEPEIKVPPVENPAVQEPKIESPSTVEPKNGKRDPVYLLRRIRASIKRRIKVFLNK